MSKAISLEVMASQRNSILFYAEHMHDLTDDAGWHGQAQCAIPKATEAMCLLAGNHGDKLITDSCTALRTISALAEGYAAHDNSSNDDDPMQVLAGIGALIRVLSESLEAGRELQFHATNNVARQHEINAAENLT